MKEQDRREHARIPVSWPVRLWIDDSLVIGRAVNVSEHGLCVITAPTQALKRGEWYRVDVVIGPEGEITLNAEVRYAAEAVVGLRTKERLQLLS
jgi:hypothetical protein